MQASVFCIHTYVNIEETQLSPKQWEELAYTEEQNSLTSEEPQ